jgi:hypothetical protein
VAGTFYEQAPPRAPRASDVVTVDLEPGKNSDGDADMPDAIKDSDQKRAGRSPDLAVSVVERRALGQAYPR